MRKFEKISFEQFKKDVADDSELYEAFSLPKRKTKNSAGYDFESLIDATLRPNEIINIPLGIKIALNEDEALLIIVRSSLGFKYNIRMCNQVGLIDSDYYNNSDNEGHMWIKIQNHGSEEFTIHKYDRLCQGIIIKYLKTDDDEGTNEIRKSGIGSTSEEVRK